jgi:hypothetical protein
MQIKLSFRVTSWCFCFFWVFLVYGYLSKESPEFSELVCLNKHQYDFCFVLNFEFPKIRMKTFMVLEKKGNTPKDSWRNGFVSTKVCSVCYLHEHTKKKTHAFIHRKGSLDKENLVEF